MDKDGRPLIRKLGTVALDQVENSPVVFHGKLYLFVGRGKFRFVEHDTGRTTPSFASGYFGNAFVDGDTVYVTVAHAKEKIHMFTSKDLVHWKSSMALDLPGFKIYNTSICKADGKYVMMFEIGEPPEQAGHGFTARFATSDDLKHWKVTPPECVYTKDRYSAPHCLRLPRRVVLRFLPRGPAGQALRDVRGPFQGPGPLAVQPAEPGVAGIARGPEAAQRQASRRPSGQADRHGGELQQLGPGLLRVPGRVVLYYSWGNQLGVEHLAEAVYDGTQAQFLRGWFPREELTPFPRRPIESVLGRA